MLLSVLVTSLVVGLAPLCQAQAAGTSAGKFVVLGCRDGQTSAWEYVPGSGELVKRYDFPQCQGTPRRLARGLPLSFLSVRMNDGKRSWNEQRLVDFRRWTARKIDLEPGLTVIGRIKGDHYLRARDGRHLRLDGKTGKVTEVDTRFWKLFEIASWWIVRDSQGEIMQFDPVTGRAMHGVRVPESHRSIPFRRGESPAVSPDGRFIAWMSGLDWGQVYSSGNLLPFLTNRLPSTIEVHDLDTGKTVETPFGVFGTLAYKYASWTLKQPLTIRFSAADQLAFLSVVDGAKWSGEFQDALDRGDVEHVTLTLPGGRVARRRATRKDLLPGPGNAQAMEKSGRSDRARARRISRILEGHAAIPGGDCPFPAATAFSPDGERFLAWISGIGFFFGDFKRNTALPVKANGAEFPRIQFVPGSE